MQVTLLDMQMPQLSNASYFCHSLKEYKVFVTITFCIFLNSLVQTLQFY